MSWGQARQYGKWGLTNSLFEVGELYARQTACFSFTKTILQCRLLPLGATMAGVWMDMRVCESTYLLNIYSQIQTKKLNFSLSSSSLCNSFTLSIDVIFIPHNSECAISQLTNTLPESVKRFYVYSICSGQNYSTFPSVFKMRNLGRKGERKQSHVV